MILFIVTRLTGSITELCLVNETRVLCVCVYVCNLRFCAFGNCLDREQLTCGFLIYIRFFAHKLQIKLSIGGRSSALPV